MCNQSVRPPSVCLARLPMRLPRLLFPILRSIPAAASHDVRHLLRPSVALISLDPEALISLDPEDGGKVDCIACAVWAAGTGNGMVCTSACYSRGGVAIMSKVRQRTRPVVR